MTTQTLLRWPKTAIKWVAATVSVAAATLSILSNASSIGIVPAAWRPRVASEAMGTVAWLGVAPASQTLYSVGDTLHLAVTATNEHGAALSKITPTWTSSRSAVASVDSTGTVVTRSSGMTTITAIVGGRAARAEVIVRQRAVAVAIAQADSLVLREGQPRQMAVAAVDARGVTLPRPRVSWHSADTLTARVDSAGLATGITPGTTSFTASVDGVTALAAVRVIPVPGYLTLLTGQDQHGRAGRKLLAPVTIQVVSLKGRPVVGVPVEFIVETGAADPAVDISDDEGKVRSWWTLGEHAGRQRLSVAVPGVDSNLVLYAEADPVPGETKLELSAEPRPGTAGELLADTAVVRVADTAGAPLPDVPVRWAALDGGTVVAANARTDSLGQARAAWTLGSKAGVQRLRMRVGLAPDGPSATLSATARPTTPDSIMILRGNGQRAAAGTAPPGPIVIQVVDRYGNGVPDVELIAQALAGTLADSGLRTDSLGQARVRWILGEKAGRQVLRVRAGGVKSPREVAARAIPGPPHTVAFVAAPATGTVSKALGKLRVQVADQFGNPIADQRVAFKARSGSVTPAAAATDSLGVATVRWTLGAKAGTQTLEAALAGAKLRTALQVQATAPAPPKAAARRTTPRAP